MSSIQPASALAAMWKPAIAHNRLGWLGALALGVLVAAIPVVGGWLEALLVLLGLGALLLTARPGRRLGEPSGLSPADAAPGR
jgi:hypothetical protein